MVLPAIMMMMVVLCFSMLLCDNGFSSLVLPVYSQGQNINSSSSQSSPPSSSFQSKAAMIDKIPSQKVTVDDINIAYKQLGKSNAKPIILITGLGATMDTWSPLLLEQLTSSNYSVTIFDNRGAGNTTAGTKQFSISQFAKDTAGLLDALKIAKADVLGWSLGSYIAQELTLTNPDKVSNLILYASGCGGQDATPTSPKIIQIITNASLSIQERIEKQIPFLFPTKWFKANPDYLNYVPIPKESVSAQIIRQQLKAVAIWTGTCNAISNITQPTLVIVGTDGAPLQDSLMLARRIPGSWLVQIRDAEHGLMYQYPSEFNRVLMTFLENSHEHKDLKMQPPS
jgi:pimeloyl-ACP methyl ester carboxylesterase